MTANQIAAQSNRISETHYKRVDDINAQLADIESQRADETKRHNKEVENISKIQNLNQATSNLISLNHTLSDYYVAQQKIAIMNQETASRVKLNEVESRYKQAMTQLAAKQYDLEYSKAEETKRFHDMTNKLDWANYEMMGNKYVLENQARINEMNVQLLNAQNQSNRTYNDTMLGIWDLKLRLQQFATDKSYKKSAEVLNYVRAWNDTLDTALDGLKVLNK